MRKITVKQFKNEYYPEADLSLTTIRNWLRNGHLLGEKTPTGTWLVIVPIHGCPFVHSQKTNELLLFLEN